MNSSSEITNSELKYWYGPCDELVTHRLKATGICCNNLVQKQSDQKMDENTGMCGCFGLIYIYIHTLIRKKFFVALLARKG